jgi:hypothetical protein
MWRHVVDVARGAGATNIKWVWCPLTEDVPNTRGNHFERYYPGRSYVDVLSLDGYNWGAATPQFGGWRSFHKIFAKPYRRIKRLGPQPIWIAEVGSATEGGSKAAWVRDMFKRARSMNRLSAIVWMDTIDAREGDWRMRSPADVLAAFGPDDDSAAAAASLRPNARVRRGRRGDAAGQSGRAAWALRISAPVHLGRRAVVRWNETAAQDGVERWRIYLNDKRVRTLRAGRSRVMRKRMNRTGRYRWKVEGVDAGGRTVVSASRGFRVVRRG